MRKVILYPPFLERGITLMPSLILIPRWAKGDKAYLAHEMTHAAQQRDVGVLFFWFKYLTDKPSRQAYEIESYKAQIAHGANAYGCAWQLATGYGLRLTIEDALEKLTA